MTLKDQSPAKMTIANKQNYFDMLNALMVRISESFFFFFLGGGGLFKQISADDKITKSAKSQPNDFKPCWDHEWRTTVKPLKKNTKNSV